ncbi:MAG: dynamin family protein [Kineosporiaceae bacterium]
MTALDPTADSAAPTGDPTVDPALNGGPSGTGRPTVTAAVRELLADVAARYEGTVWQQRALAAGDRLTAPLRVAVAGAVSAGKSTVVNALVGARIAATDAGECTRVVTEYAYAPAPRAWAVLPEGDRRGGHVPVELRPDPQAGDRVLVDLGELPAADVLRLHVELPLATLRALTVIDTPGTRSTSRRLGERSQRYLTADDADRTPPPDAVVYVMRRLHAADVAFLEAFRDPSARAVAPVNALAVLTRADELGGGAEDAMDLAGEVAAAYGRDHRLRRLVQVVLPLAGLVAEAAGTLAVAEQARLAQLACAPEPVTGEMLLSAERFVAARRYGPLDAAARAALLDRLGLVGLRWALAELRGERAPAAGPSEGAAALPLEGGAARDRLCAALARRSGLDAVRSVLDGQVAGRAEVVKADAALRLLAAAAAEHPRVRAEDLHARAERLRLSVHDFAELDLLNDLRCGRVELPSDVREDAERLLGARGARAHERLGLGEDAGAEAVADAARASHERWVALGADLLASREEQRAAGVLQRTCEGLLAAG